MKLEKLESNNKRALFLTLYTYYTIFYIFSSSTNNLYKRKRREKISSTHKFINIKFIGIKIQIVYFLQY